MALCRIRSLWAVLAAVAAIAAPMRQGDAADLSPIADADREFWSFRKLAPPAPPSIGERGLARTSVDAFLLAGLRERGLSYSPEANRFTLIRRLSLDLLGVPPTMAEVDDFLADTSPDAYERLVDRLLSSPRFGERWGRHWLDVVGYVDMVGFEVDATNFSLVGEGKWRYRDYVIDCLNADLPYDRFVVEQLAGDELVDWRNAERFTPEIRRSLVATGFLRTARDQTHEPESNIPLSYYGVLHDTVEMVGSSLLGLTLQCARCHDHKFDPLPQRDYYQLMALFTPAYNPENWKPVFPWKPEIQDRALADISAAEKAQLEQHNADLDRREAELDERLAQLRRPYLEQLRNQKAGAIPEVIRADVLAALAAAGENRNEVQKYLAGKFEAMLEVDDDEVKAALSESDRALADEIGSQAEQLNAQRRRFGKIQALYDVGPPPVTHLLTRGNYETPGPAVEPGFLAVLMDPSDGSAVPLPPADPARPDSLRRTALAKWLTAPNSRSAALMSRVMVNRIWQHLFGEGLVRSSENFGLGGQPPSHPELLESLSAEFVAGGWRIKPLVRLLVTSAAYRQASHRVAGDSPSESALVQTGGSADPDVADPEVADPANQLLWRMRLKRLESEAIRDALLAVSGELNCAMGGPPVMLATSSDGMVAVDESKLETPSAGHRRSVYLLARRAYNLSLLNVFDQPLVSVNCPKRETSVVPLQSLAMLNDAFVATQAERYAARIAGASNEDEVIVTAFRRALVRPPNEAELSACREQLAAGRSAYIEAGESAPTAASKALVQLCHMLLNTSEFLYCE